MKNTFTPLSLAFLPLINWLAKLQGGYDIKEMSPIKYAKAVKVPVLHIQGKYDDWTTHKDTEKIFNGFVGPKELYWIDKKMNRFDAYNYVGLHPEKIITFLNRYL